MNKNKNYSAAPDDIADELKQSVRVADFLPSPDVIAAMLKKDPTIPVTMNLKKETVKSYQRYAKEHGIKYQAFISKILDNYAKTI